MKTRREEHEYKENSNLQKYYFIITKLKSLK